ncbi:MAG: MCE family protein [Deltaproteobacteria bacterium]|nr:MCE family protein [Deltaproteobacteria bacterium]
MATTATNNWKLGLFVVLGVITMLAALFWLGARRFQRTSFPTVSYFDESVQGLDVGSPVKFRGVTVGNVADITIAPDHRHVQVTSEIYLDAIRRLGLRDRAPRKGEEFLNPLLRMQLVSAGITGVRFLQTDFFHPGRYPEPTLPFEPPWNYIPSVPSTLKSVGDTAMEVVNRLPDIETRITETLTTMNAALGSFDRFVTSLQSEHGSFDRLLVQLRTTTTGVGNEIAAAKLPETTASIRSTAGAVSTTASGFGEMREDLEATLATLRETLDSVRAVADALERDPSALLRGSRPGEPPPEVTK